MTFLGEIKENGEGNGTLSHQRIVRLFVSERPVPRPACDLIFELVVINPRQSDNELH